MLPEPGSSASSGTSPEKRNTFKSQAQDFQPCRIVPDDLTNHRDAFVNADIFRTRTEKLNKNEKKSDREEGVPGGEGLSPFARQNAGRRNLARASYSPIGDSRAILSKAAELAKLPREQLVMVRAESAVWNDGSRGCPEPGIMATRKRWLSGYWVVINAADQNYDFRVDSRGNFRLCPRGTRPSTVTSRHAVVQQHIFEITHVGTKPRDRL